MGRRSTGDCIVRVEHEGGEGFAFFGPFYLAHKHAKNVYDFEGQAHRAGYKTERMLLYPGNDEMWASFMEARKPPGDGLAMSVNRREREEL